MIRSLPDTLRENSHRKNVFLMSDHPYRQGSTKRGPFPGLPLFFYAHLHMKISPPHTEGLSLDLTLFLLWSELGHQLRTSPCPLKEWGTVSFLLYCFATKRGHLPAVPPSSLRSLMRWPPPLNKSSYATKFHHLNSPSFLPFLLFGVIRLTIRTVSKLVTKQIWSFIK